jgi:hypothetical protein
MPDTSNRFLLVKRLLIATVALVAVTLASIIGSRFAVESLFRGIASSKSTGLSAFPSWDSGSMLAKGRLPLIAQASEDMLEAERQHAALLSTVARAVIRITLTEDYRAPLQASLAGEFLQLQNSLVEGVGTTISSVSLFLGVLFEFGLPLLFWAALLFGPGRLAWRRCRHTVTAVPAAE